MSVIIKGENSPPIQSRQSCTALLTKMLTSSHHLLTVRHLIRFVMSVVSKRPEGSSGHRHLSTLLFCRIFNCSC